MAPSRSGDFDHQVMLEAGDALVDRCVSAAGEAQQRREVVVHLRCVTGSPVAARANGQRIALRGEIPQCEVEEVDRFLENPRSDTQGVVAPALGAAPIGVPEQVDVDGQRAADRAFVDQPLGAAPLRREPEFVADRHDSSAGSLRGDQALAILGRRRHRLFQQHVLPGHECRAANLRVKMVGQHDVDHVDGRVGDRLAPIERHMGGRKAGSRRRCRHLAAAGDRRQCEAVRLGDRTGVIAAPRPVADQREAHRSIRWLAMGDVGARDDFGPRMLARVRIAIAPRAPACC